MLKLIKNFGLFILILMLLCSCTKEVELENYLANTNTNFYLSVHALEQENVSSHPIRRTVYVYGISNNEHILLHSEYESSTRYSKINLFNVEYDSLSVIAELHQYHFGVVQQFLIGTYYYENTIVLPSFECDLYLSISSNQWIE